MIEATRHEALINVAFADVDASILCPYDANGLAPSILADAERTHPHVIAGSGTSAERSLRGPAGDLGRVRAVSPRAGADDGDAHAGRGSRAGATDHGGVWSRGGPVGRGRARSRPRGRRGRDERGAPRRAAGRSSGSGGERAGIVCEVTDHGKLEDPLAGRRFPAPEWPSRTRAVADQPGLRSRRAAAAWPTGPRSGCTCWPGG